MDRIRLPRETTSIRAHPHCHQNHCRQSKHLNDQDQHVEDDHTVLLLVCLSVNHFSAWIFQDWKNSLQTQMSGKIYYPRPGHKYLIQIYTTQKQLICAFKIFFILIVRKLIEFIFEVEKIISPKLSRIIANLSQINKRLSQKCWE